jgi:hypothetical protein
MGSGVDTISLSQFSITTALSHLREITDVPLLSAPRNNVRLFKQLLTMAVGQKRFGFVRSRTRLITFV